MTEPVTWSLDPHGRVKHLILKRHLDAWLPIMTRTFKQLLYVDGFAGPGVYEGGEPGSPIIALRAAIHNARLRTSPPSCVLGFLLIEERDDRVAILREQIRNLVRATPLPRWTKYLVKHGTFEDVISRWFDHWSLKGRRPMFLFIDPFGYSGIPMSLIARIATVPHSECLINFTYKSINRWAIHGDRAREAHLDDLYGSPDWRSRRGDEHAMVDFYLAQLGSRAGFQYQMPFRMRNRVGATEYYLTFATNSPKGLTVMKAAAWKADPHTGQVFSDADDPDQLFLDVAPDSLRSLLLRQFAGKGWVTMGDVEEFVRHTHYSEEQHLRQGTLAPMEKENPPSVEVEREPGSRKGSFNKVRRLRFLAQVRP